LSDDSIEFFNVDGESIEKESKRIEWDINAAEKGGYEHFMLKEMNEQPKAVRDTMNPRIKDNQIVKNWE
jgi:glucosamine--fructose-6-phosphate aminotransferase (isomerizing)